MKDNYYSDMVQLILKHQEDPHDEEKIEEIMKGKIQY